MSRYFKFIVLALLLVGLMAGSAFAGNTKVNSSADNAAFTAALEAMGAARNVVLVGAVNGSMSYLTSQVITSGNFASVVFTGAAFSGNTVRLCNKDSAAAGNQTAVATPTAGSTSFNFQLSATNGTTAVPSASIFYLTTDGACNTTGAASNMIVQLSSTAAATNPSVSISIISAGNIPVDTASSAQLAAIASEYATQFGTTSDIVDYLLTPGNGTQFNIGGSSNLASINAGNTNLFAVKNTLYNLSATNTAATLSNPTPSLTVKDTISLTDTANWQGISKVFVTSFSQSASNCTDNAATNIVGNTSALNGTLSLPIPATAFTGVDGNGVPNLGAANFAMCLISGGNTAMSVPRTITGSQALSVTGTGANSPAATSAATVETLSTNAFQGYVTWVVDSASVPTFCLINNNDTAKTATVLMDILSSETSTTVSGQSLGTLAPKTSVLLTLNNTGAQLTGGTLVAYPSTLSSTSNTSPRFSPKITVTANPSNVTMACIQTDPSTGVKRAVPVLTNSALTQ